MQNIVPSFDMIIVFHITKEAVFALAAMILEKRSGQEILARSLVFYCPLKAENEAMCLPTDSLGDRSSLQPLSCKFLATNHPPLG